MTFHPYPQVSDLQGEITDSQHGARGDLHNTLLPRDCSRDFTGHFQPDTDKLRNIGAPTRRINAAYLDTIFSDRIGITDGISTELKPTLDGANSIGSPTRQWLNAHLAGIAYVGGIQEAVADAGVTIEGILLKDGVLEDSAYPNALLKTGGTMIGILTLDDAVGALRFAEDVMLHDYAGGILACMNKAGTFFRDFRTNLLQCDSGMIPITKASNFYLRGRDNNNAQVNVARIINNVVAPYMDIYDIAMSNLPVVDPEDGTNRLWNNEGVVTVGT